MSTFEVMFFKSVALIWAVVVCYFIKRTRHVDGEKAKLCLKTEEKFFCSKKKKLKKPIFSNRPSDLVLSAGGRCIFIRLRTVLACDWVVSSRGQ